MRGLLDPADRLATAGRLTELAMVPHTKIIAPKIKEAA